VPIDAPGSNEPQTVDPATEASRPYLSHDRRFLALALAFGVLVFALEWYRHATYRSLTYDLAYMDQGIWLMAHGHSPYVSLIGRSILTDHFAPVLFVFVPLYFLVSTTLWLFVAQAIALSIGLLALPPLLDELHVGGRWRVPLVLSFVTSPLLWNAALFDFHTSTLAVPFLMVGIIAALRDDMRMLGLMSLATILMRDDLGLAVAGLAFIGFTRTRHRQLRLAIVFVAVAWVVVIGRLGLQVSSPAVWNANYGYLGPNATAALHHPVRTVSRIVAQIWSGGNLETTIDWLAPLGFLPLLAPARTLSGFTWVFALFAATRFSQGGLSAYHYGAPVFPFLLLAAGTVAYRARHRVVEFLAPVGLATFAVASLVATNPFYSWISHYRAPPRSIATAALSEVLPGDRVTATATLGPHLSHRVLLLPFPYPFMRGDDLSPTDSRVTRVGAQYAAQIDAIAIYVRGNSPSPAVLRAFLRLPALRQFDLVFDREGVLIFRRASESR
jgi:uncharacterized membrane protein